MNREIIVVPAIVSICLLAGCASTGSLVSVPDVNLRNVEATELGLSEQTFVLEFDVQNPNPFPLPVSAISYGVDLDGHRFATGSTSAAIMIPATGQADFTISVEVNLMRSAPQLLYIVRDGLKRDIPYQLTGEFALDLPMAESLRFQTNGSVRMHEVSQRAFKAD
jgi:LEA14-like dessication related protein